VQKAGETRLKKVLEALVDDFDFCLIDSPPEVNILAASVLLAAGEGVGAGAGRGIRQFGA